MDGWFGVVVSSFFFFVMRADLAIISVSDEVKHLKVPCAPK